MSELKVSEDKMKAAREKYVKAMRMITFCKRKPGRISPKRMKELEREVESAKKTLKAGIRERREKYLSRRSPFEIR